MSTLTQAFYNKLARLIAKLARHIKRYEGRQQSPNVTVSQRCNPAVPLLCSEAGHPLEGGRARAPHAIAVPRPPACLFSPWRVERIR